MKRPVFRSVLHIKWPKYWSFSFSISPSNEYSELISFRMDWFYLLAVQGTLKVNTKRHWNLRPERPSLEGLMLMRQYFGHVTQRADSLGKKT